MHVPEQERSKLDYYSEKYVFIGMIQALRVISCEIQAPKISWDVEFDEECIWNWSTQKEEKYHLFSIYLMKMSR